MKAAIGDYLYTRYGYYEVTQVSADGHPVVSKHDEARNSYAVSCCRGRYYVDGILDSYPVIEVLTDVEYLLLKLNGELVKTRPPRNTSSTGKR